jgi:hypothetical protein
MTNRSPTGWMGTANRREPALRPGACQPCYAAERETSAVLFSSPGAGSWTRHMHDGLVAPLLGLVLPVAGASALVGVLVTAAKFGRRRLWIAAAAIVAGAVVTQWLVPAGIPLYEHRCGHLSGPLLWGRRASHASRGGLQCRWRRWRAIDSPPMGTAAAAPRTRFRGQLAHATRRRTVVDRLNGERRRGRYLPPPQYGVERARRVAGARSGYF